MDEDIIIISQTFFFLTFNVFNLNVICEHFSSWHLEKGGSIKQNFIPCEFMKHSRIYFTKTFTKFYLTY